MQPTSSMFYELVSMLNTMDSPRPRERTYFPSLSQVEKDRLEADKNRRKKQQKMAKNSRKRNR